MTDIIPHDQASPPATLDAEILNRARAAFIQAMPKISRLAHMFHRRIRGELHEEAVAETEAFAWKAFRVLAAKGRDPLPLTGRIVDFAARRIRGGARFAGKVPVQDALSADARRKNNYFVTSLPHGDDDEVAAEVRDALCHRVPSPADEAICKADYEEWLRSLTARQRTVAQDLASGLNMSDVAQRGGVSKASVQQMRATLSDRWDEYQGEGRGR